MHAITFLRGLLGQTLAIFITKIPPPLSFGALNDHWWKEGGGGGLLKIEFLIKYFFDFI